MTLARTNPEYSGSLPIAALLAFAAILIDQLAAPVLHTTAPVWAVLALLLLTWRRGSNSQDSPIPQGNLFPSRWRLLAFSALHLTLILAAGALAGASPSASSGALQNLTGSPGNPSWLLATIKLFVLLPALALFPARAWRSFAAVYRAEFLAALVALLTFFPARVMDTLWPWYGQVLGRFVYLLAWPLAPALGYVKAFFPTITGPDLDVTILLGCSGFNGVELFDYLFGFVVI